MILGPSWAAGPSLVQENVRAFFLVAAHAADKLSQIYAVAVRWVKW